MSARGFSIPELLISCALLTALTSLLTLAWIKGARSWLSTSRLSTRLSQVQILKQRIEGELSGSSVQGVECEPALLSFPSAYGLRGSAEAETYFRMAGQVAPRWRKYCVYYWQPAERKVYFVEVPIASGNAAESRAQPLSQLGPAPRPLSFYASGGKVLAEQVTGFQVQLEDQVVQLTLDTTEAYTGRTNRTLHFVSATLVRN